MREIKYRLCDPTGNITVLVESQVQKSDRRRIASEIMKNEPTAEQVGFISSEGQRLDMAGGEFCGNASMSAAALCLMNSGKDVGSVGLSVSGTPESVEVSIEKTAENDYFCILKMPSPVKTDTYELTVKGTKKELPCVKMQGITHIIMGKRCMTRPEAEKAVVSLASETGERDCLGLMFFDEKELTLEPLVYVPAADTLFWESSCGSGTCAVGAYLAARDGMRVKAKLSEPAGVLEVDASPDGAIFLSGHVALGKEKTLLYKA